MAKLSQADKDFIDDLYIQSLSKFGNISPQQIAAAARAVTAAVRLLYNERNQLFADIENDRPTALGDPFTTPQQMGNI